MVYLESRQEVTQMPWHLPEGIDRMEVNAALTTLTERWDIDAAFLVVHAFCTLPGLTPDETQDYVQYSKSRDTVRGHTPEHGTLSVDTPGPLKERQIYGPPEEALAHIGSFRILRVISSTHDETACISFEPFQRDLLALVGYRPMEPKFQLDYYQAGLTPLGLYRLDAKQGPLPWYQWMRQCWERLWGQSVISVCWVLKRQNIHIITKEDLAEYERRFALRHKD